MPSRNVEIVFLGDSKSAEKAMRRLQDSADKTKTGTDKLSEGLTSAGTKLTKGLTLPILAAGAAVGAAALALDDARDSIRASTGATGAELDALNQSFDDVAASVPASMDDVAGALSELDQRTDATGQTLEDLAEAELNLARLTGDELEPQIAATTRLFGDWSVATEDQVGTLDMLLRASQETGLGVTALADSVVKFGAPLRQLGFTLEESVALIGSFEREGVNADLVLGSLRRSLSTMARAGEPAVETLDRTVEAIKNAGSTSDANRLAMELFGAKAGPDMAAAIREGRFEIDDLTAAIANGGESIAGAVEDTDGLQESLTLLKNRALLAAEPLGVVLVGAMEAATPLIEGLVGAVAGLASKFGELPSGVQTALVGIAAMAAAAGPVASLTGKVIGNVKSFKDWYNQLRLVRGLAGQVTPSLGALTVGVGLATAAVTAAVLVYGEWKATKDRIRAATDEFTAALKAEEEGTHGATEAAAAKQIADRKLGDELKLLGISAADMADAVLGDEDALKRVNKALGGATTGGQEAVASFLGIGQALNALGVDFAEAGNASAEVRTALAELGIGFNEAGEAIALEDEAQHRQIQGLHLAGGVLEDTGGPVVDFAGKQAELDEATEEATDALLDQASELRALTDPLFAAQRATDKVRDAQQKYHDVLADPEHTAADAAAAAADLGSALVDEQGAAENLTAAYDDGVLSLDDVIAKYQEWVDEGRITQDEANAVIGILRDTDAAAAALDGRSIAIDVVVDSAVAMGRLRDLQTAARDAGGIIGIGGLSEFHSGGVVGSGSGVRLPGLDADERVIKAQVGEVVLPRGALRGTGNGHAAAGAAAPGPTVVVYVAGSVTSERDLAETIHRVLLEKQRRNGGRSLL